MIVRSVLTLASRGGPRGRLSILIFHRVLNAPDPLLPEVPCASQFDAMLRHVASSFVVLPLSVAVRRLYEGTLPARALAITFDDGYADNLTVAAPLLRRHGLAATVFVATGTLDGGCMWNDRVIAAVRSTREPELDLQALDLGVQQLATLEERRAAIDELLNRLKYLPLQLRRERADQILRIAGVEAPEGLMLTRESLRRLAEGDVEIGAHTVSHPILADLPADTARQEIVESKRQLEQELGHNVTLFAYPNGKPGRDYGAEHVQMVRDAGFSAAVSTSWGAASRASDVFQLPRFTPWARQPLKFDLLMLRNLRQGPEQRAA